ncbi:ABC transporter ATP-binding protein [Aestuariirhabdus litorea]|uniref:Spermidine/putrescine import ATP-binding protein PotA n=1 Tax=Aestuariirhabdus litorea TaxID=2528527 RepID=A0A3P3VK27_9GAMM|nr:ABC transporter ATP-binding protein [Aestuariirhabdus litorea]RRJ83082.1 ABC transporter ATP-binding protein [Aestuariirhabdus litorea]RWW93240.1 polyamine ABC transporter ATP-binding protein [Endozoicomonadaceae bacterium GTF-13]
MSDANDRYVSFQDVQKTYDGENLVVKGFNLDIKKGEFVTMLGPSGSGKTTCLMMLAGFETPTHGEIFINGSAVNRIAPHKRNIGMMFQNYALFPHMTIAENLAYPLQVRKLSRADIEEKVKRALDMVELSGFEQRRPKQLSGGQQQRVALARALVFEPTLVLMDEPLGALDKQLREQMQYEIKHIHERLGVTVVYVTHDQGEALTMSDRIAVFNNGVVQQLDTPQGLYERPMNSFVADFIGENNVLFGEVERYENGRCILRVNGEPVVATAVTEQAPGSKVIVSIRPERVVLDTQGNGHENHFVGQVVERIYHGDHIRVRVGLLGQGQFILKLPNNAANSGLKEGDSVQVAWSSNDARALDIVQ